MRDLVVKNRSKNRSKSHFSRSNHEWWDTSNLD